MISLEVETSQYIPGRGVLCRAVCLPDGLKIGDEVLVYMKGDSPVGPSKLGRARMRVKGIEGSNVLLSGESS